MCVILYKASEDVEQRKATVASIFQRERKHRPREAELLAQGYTGISKKTDILPTVLVFLYMFDRCISSSRADGAGPQAK